MLNIRSYYCPTTTQQRKVEKASQLSTTNWSGPNWCSCEETAVLVHFASVPGYFDMKTATTPTAITSLCRKSRASTCIEPPETPDQLDKLYYVYVNQIRGRLSLRISKSVLRHSSSGLRS